MNTIMKQVSEEQIEEAVIFQAGQILKQGGLVAFPTETVYGLGANALDAAAAERTYTAKGRPSDNPLIIHIAQMEALEKIVTNIPEPAKKVAEIFWPGPLTMIFQKTEVVPYGITGGLDTVAVRMPASRIARAVIQAGGGYISAPSANTSGRPSPTTAQHVAEDMEGKIEMIVDGGAVEIGVESTILDMTVEPPMILRPGAITKEMLQDVIGTVTVDQALLHEDSTQAPKAPGMKYRHYAPRAQLSVVEGSSCQVSDYINRETQRHMDAGRKVGIIATEETKERYLAGDVKCVGTRADERTIAAGLYGSLREFDADEVDVIYSEAFDNEGIGSAVMNRLLKAAGHHVIKV